MVEPKDTKEPFPASGLNANYGRSKETDCTAAQIVLQDMLQVRRQEPDLGFEMQEMSRQPNEAEEQDAWSQEVISFIHCNRGGNSHSGAEIIHLLM